MTTIHYATPAIAAAAEEITRVSAQTDANHQRSLAIVSANAENFGGQGSEAFQQAIAMVNQKYSQAQQTLTTAGATLAQCNESMTQADAAAAAQY